MDISIDKIKKRWQLATSPEVFKNASFLAGSTFFASFFRVPFFMVANNAITGWARKLAERNEAPLDPKDPDFELKSAIQGEIKKDNEKNGLPWQLNLFASSLQTFVFPITIFAGGLLKEFFTADIQVDDRAIDAASKAMEILEASKSNLGTQADIILPSTASPEQYAAEHSYLKRVLNGQGNETDVLNTIEAAQHLLTRGIARASASLDARKEMNDGAMLKSKELESFAGALNSLMENKTVQNGTLHHQQGNQAQPMTATEVSQMAQDVAQQLSQRFDLHSSINVMKLEQEVAQASTARAA